MGNCCFPEESDENKQPLLKNANDRRQSPKSVENVSFQKNAMTTIVSAASPLIPPDNEVNSNLENKPREKRVRRVPFGSVHLGLNKNEVKEVMTKGLVHRLTFQRRTLQKDSSAQSDQIIAEFLDTEVSYVNNLSKLLETFVYPLKEIVGAEPLKAIFPNIDMVYEINQLFLKDMDAVVKDETKDIEEEFAGFLKRFSSSFKLYIPYITNYGQCLARLRQLQEKNKKISELIHDKENQLKLDKERMTDLSSYLILPIQRLPRYQLLLGELLKNTNENRKVYPKILEAYNAVKDVTFYCNTKTSEIENLQKMTQLQFQLGMDGLIQPHRKFLISEEKVGSILRVREAGGNTTIAVNGIYLFTDIFVCSSQKVTFGFKLFVLSLQSLTLKDTPENVKGMQFISKEVESLKLIFPTETTKDEWRKAILNQQDSLTKNSIQN